MSKTADSSAAVSGRLTSRPSLRAHIQIARIDHWFKNIFMLPGIVAALGLDRENLLPGLTWRVLLGVLSFCLVASSNYSINEVLDSRSDLAHPRKRHRPAPSGQISFPLAYAQWLALMVLGVGCGFSLSPSVGKTALALWIMGCVYNIRPLRSKDLPYIDVLSEAINNPLRMLGGWYLTGTLMPPPASLLLSYWMVGSYFMAIKRYSEFREFQSHDAAAAYRPSFRYYTAERLLVSVMFYGSTAMLFFGAFAVRYRLELILAFPLVALVMATYLSLAFKPDSAVQNPESLFREPTLMAAVIVCAVALLILQLVRVPLVYHFFTSMPLPISGT